LWVLAAYGMACNVSMKDNAYSSAAYSGWAPAAGLAVSFEVRRQLHTVDAEFTSGNISHPAGQQSGLKLSHWGFSYKWQHNLGSPQDNQRLQGSLGVGINWQQVTREYAEFVNSDPSRDRWSTIDIHGMLRLQIDEAGKFKLLLAGGLGLFGLFDLDAKRPESNPVFAQSQGKDLTWMPGSNAFSGSMDVQMLFRIGNRQLVGIGYMSEGTTYKVDRLWGYARGGVRLKYALSL
jgi:hypothetical protein